MGSIKSVFYSISKLSGTVGWDISRADICVHLNRRVFNDHDAFRYATDSPRNSK